MISKKFKAMVLAAVCILTIPIASAQSSFVVKGTDKVKTVNNGSIHVKASSGVKNKDTNGLTISNGVKNINISNGQAVSYGYVTATSLNVRSGASSSHNVIGSLSKGTKVEIVQSLNGWYKIKYGSGFGYVSSTYISVTNPPVQPEIPNPPSVGKIDKVVIDAGHGGSDPGAIGYTGYKEKDMTLNVSKKLEQILESKGIDTVMTRKTDKFLELSERTTIANRTDADFFISIHGNSFSNTTANGIETFSHSSTGAGAEIAKSIQTRLVKKLDRYNRGHKTANFYVIKHTNMPAALTELGFLSNPTEESLMKTDSYQTKAAAAIAEGIMTYK